MDGTGDGWLVRESAGGGHVVWVVITGVCRWKGLAGGVGWVEGKGKGVAGDG